MQAEEGHCDRIWLDVVLWEFKMVTRMWGKIAYGDICLYSFINGMHYGILFCSILIANMFLLITLDFVLITITLSIYPFHVCKYNVISRES